MNKGVLFPSLVGAIDLLLISLYQYDNTSIFFVLLYSLHASLQIAVISMHFVMALLNEI